MFFTTGLHADYHRVTDTVDKIVFPKMAKIAQLVYESGFSIADTERRLERDNKGLKGVLPKDYARPALDKQRLGELIDLIGTIGLGDKENRSKDILGRVYEYFLALFASAEGKKGGQFYTPRCVVQVLVSMLAPYKGRVYDPCCGSGGLLIKCEIAMEAAAGTDEPSPLKLYGQEYIADTWAMANMNLIIHDFEGEIEIGDTFKNPKFRERNGGLRTFDRVVANPMWNQNWFSEADYDADELGRFVLDGLRAGVVRLHVVLQGTQIAIPWTTI